MSKQRPVLSVKVLAIVAGVCVAALAIGLRWSPVVRASATSPHATFGQVPPAAFTSSGINWSLAPEYIATVGHSQKVVGYIPKIDIERSVAAGRGPMNGGSYSPTVSSSVLPVYNKHLTLVGHMYTGLGFVPLGQSVADEAPPTTFVGPSVASSSGSPSG